ncbi:Dexh-box atp-dependent rna helicase dexh3, partial [Thalictrum thalictroides]
IRLFHAFWCHICRKERKGDVLVFMTGWDDIISLKDQLKAHPHLRDPNRVLLLTCHGSMATSEQVAEPSWKSAHVSTHDIVGNHKTTATSSTQVVPSQNTSSTSASISTSSGFLRPSRAITASGMHRQHSYNKGFGSALNIKTLIAAAKIRDTTIEATLAPPATGIMFKGLLMCYTVFLSEQLENLNTRQAKTEALLAQLANVPALQSILSSGESSR